MSQKLSLDAIDLALLNVMLDDPKAGVREFARRAGIARATAQNRIDKMVDRGVITSFAPSIDAEQLGFGLSAKIHLIVRQASLDSITRGLEKIPYIIQVDSLAGTHDMLCSIAARDHAHLEEIAQMIMEIDGVERTKTDIVLRRRVPHRTAQLISECQPDSEPR